MSKQVSWQSCTIPEPLWGLLQVHPGKLRFLHSSTLPHLFISVTYASIRMKKSTPNACSNNVYYVLHPRYFGLCLCVTLFGGTLHLEVKKWTVLQSNSTAAYKIRHWDRDALYLIHLSLGLLEAPVAWHCTRTIRTGSWPGEIHLKNKTSCKIPSDSGFHHVNRSTSNIYCFMPKKALDMCLKQGLLTPPAVWGQNCFNISLRSPNVLNWLKRLTTQWHCKRYNKQQT